MFLFQAAKHSGGGALGQITLTGASSRMTTRCGGRPALTPLARGREASRFDGAWSPVAEIVGIVLAGGRSRRMDGTEKAFLDLDGRPLIAHVVERLRPQVGALVISANGDPARFDFLGLPVVADPFPDFAGPLAGILAGLAFAGEHSVDGAIRGHRPDRRPVPPF